MSITITADQLRAAHACDDQVALFKRLFPQGYSAETLAQFEADCVAHASRLDLRWAGANLIGREYKRQRDALWAEYDRQRAPLRAEYERQRAALFARLFWVKENR